MFIKSFIFTCFLAGISVTHAVPLGSNLRATIEKRHKPDYTPQLVPEGAGHSPFDQAILCFVKAGLHPPADQHKELTASKTLEQCWKLANAAITPTPVTNLTPIATNEDADDSDDQPTGPQTGPKGQAGPDTKDADAPKGDDTGAAAQVVSAQGAADAVQSATKGDQGAAKDAEQAAEGPAKEAAGTVQGAADTGAATQGAIDAFSAQAKSSSAVHYGDVGDDVKGTKD